MTKTGLFFRMFRTMTLLAVALLASQAAFSQKISKIPALGPNSPLSPTNTADYARIAEQYVTAACLGNVSSPCVYQADEAVRLRDTLVFIVKAQADAAFTNYRTGRRHKSQIYNLFLDILEIAASTAISITNGERVKSVIADGLTFLQLSHKSVNKNLILQETQVLFNAMETKRARIYERILTRLAEDDRKYPFPAALGDIILYAKAGTIDEALSELAQTTAGQKKDADEKVVTAEGKYLDKVATLRQAADAKSGFKLLNSLANDIAAAATSAAAFAKCKAIAAEIDSRHRALIDANPTLAPLLAAVRAEANRANPDGARLPNALLALRAALAADRSLADLYESVNLIILTKGI